MKRAVAKVIGGVSLVVFVVWYITTKTDYWWVALLFVAVVTVSAILSYRSTTKSTSGGLSNDSRRGS